MQGMNAADVNHEAWVCSQETHAGMAQRFPLQGGEFGTAAQTVSLRDQYLGATPGKWSKTGLEVQERMRTATPPTLRELPNGEREILYGGKWHALDETVDMAHTPLDAVTYWNTICRSHGHKSDPVRTWMLDSGNYTLMPRGPNRSAGAMLGETYLPPVSGGLPTIK